MLPTIEHQRDTQDDQDRRVAIADARRAAQVASEVARACTEWSAISHAGEDDAADAVRAAWRAQHSAQRAEHSGTAMEAVGEARAAWAAVMSAVEADGRVIAAIAEEMAAA